MLISKKLLEASQFNPTETTHKKTIVDLCGMIEARKISLPVYQRDLSWNLKKCIELLDYQLLGKAPVSPISMNNIQDVQNAIPQISFIDRGIMQDIKPGLLSVVDGQQRLTTNYKAFTNHDDFKTIVLDLTRGCFLQNMESVKANQIPVGILFNKDDGLLKEYCSTRRSLSKYEVTTALIQIKAKFNNYSYTLNQAIDLDEDDQMRWFEVLNNAGSRVTDIQMRFAKMKIREIDIYNDYARAYIEKMDTHGYADFFKPHNTNLTYPVAALNPAYVLVTGGIKRNNFAPMAPDTKQAQISQLEPEKLKTCFEITLTALDKAIEFINDNNLKRPARIDYINYLLGFFVENSICDMSNTVRTAVIKWYNDTSFTNKSNTERRHLYSSLLNLAKANC